MDADNQNSNDPCGCIKRMAALEESYPQVADFIRPVHETAMGAMRLTISTIKKIKATGRAAR